MRAARRPPRRRPASRRCTTTSKRAWSTPRCARPARKNRGSRRRVCAPSAPTDPPLRHSGHHFSQDRFRMSIEVRVPQLPESVTDATLVAWHKKPGEPVGRDENLVDLETDKVVLEVPAPSAGVIKEIKVENGATVTSGQVLAILEAGEGAVAAPKPQAAAAAPAPEAPKAAGASAGTGGKVGPSAKRMVEENKLDAGQIAGSGRDGRISKSDVIQHMAAARDTTPAPAPKAAKPAAVQLPAPGSRNEQRVAMTRLRA